MSTVAATLKAAVRRLEMVSQSSPHLEAQLLLSQASGLSQTQLYAWPDRELDKKTEQRFALMLQQRMLGKPIAHLTGKREFWSMEFAINEHTLIPRPETERLVELALERIPTAAAARVLDLGCGSGVIAAAIASERPRCEVTATDCSVEALAMARTNLDRLGLHRVQIFVGDWFEAVDEGDRYDFILSNPPYIAEDDPHLNQGDLPWEPRSALVAGPRGLDHVRRIIDQAPRHLRPSGWLLLEHGLDQGQEVRATLEAAGFREIATARDMEGRDRVSMGRRS